LVLYLQINATKLVTEELQWTEVITSRLLPMVYTYWLNKRNKYGKPLCRKYWPQVNSSDTNPRQVFRYRPTTIILITDRC